MKVSVEFDLKNEKQKFLFEHVLKMLEVDIEMRPPQHLPQEPTNDINVVLTGRPADPADTRAMMEDANL